MDRSIERDYDRHERGQSGWGNPEGAEWHRPIDQRFYDRGSRYDQAGYRRGTGTGFEYEERYRPGGDFGRRHEEDEGRRERRGRAPDYGRRERPQDVYDRRFEPGRYAGTNTYGSPDANDRGLGLGGGDRSGRGPHRGVGPKDYRRSDERIREEICQHLTDHGWIDASNVEIHVEDGEVTLEGTVDTREAKRLAYDIVDVVPGVTDVHNRLTLQGTRRGTAPQRGGGDGSARTRS